MHLMTGVCFVLRVFFVWNINFTYISTFIPHYYLVASALATLIFCFPHNYLLHPHSVLGQIGSSNKVCWLLIGGDACLSSRHAASLCLSMLSCLWRFLVPVVLPPGLSWPLHSALISLYFLLTQRVPIFSSTFSLTLFWFHLYWFWTCNILVFCFLT